jgi:catalase (peroxidase I)
MNIQDAPAYASAFKMFAKNASHFYMVFARSYARLLELGVSGLAATDADYVHALSACSSSAIRTVKCASFLLLLALVIVYELRLFYPL